MLEIKCTPVCFDGFGAFFEIIALKASPYSPFLQHSPIKTCSNPLDPRVAFALSYKSKNSYMYFRNDTKL